MSVLPGLLSVSRGAAADAFVGQAGGPAGKRAFGGLLMAQSLAAASQTVNADMRPTAMHLQYLRGGEAGEKTDYAVTRVYDGRTAAARRVESFQAGRMLTAATVSFSVDLPGPEHSESSTLPDDPELLPRTGPPGPAPAVPLDELDIRIIDDRSSGEFVRRMWWRAMVPMSPDQLSHMTIACYVTDLYGIDPALQVHGHSMQARTHRSGTTDFSIWFHHAIHADRWNLLESRSPGGGRGRGVITSSLVGADGIRVATLVQEGLIADR
ncbi:acyl-CoA thioesterase II [Mycobacterium sp. CBMA293]|uniref:acyl-CoA thioesterase n=2 Tax=Mycolicibacterium TaxID=1866885 RepID=UPI0012DF6793|nr:MULTISPECIES: acyl-CoA thioesterase domain-containing protein [unclassified Mycolicibacterium]MUL45015.1 acyl-CoA thioesterase II [Mycolicibacterium sp. CBMA 360]MUL57874.1 acyl-CoA thioesterase II [Mycolicibacterium sp. CBMA 335]MUL72677.1 acyl-CoA thioesterase II [Mycolicibacterium sp. CBMA 311]MUL95610.1 acyl-CoA thioesterase II [Mycolicibacterium sp. CBMA 230]MUM07304.1 acyl-CoA thioesterase II [Mycolicibacterium sp. CBMA 213]